MKSQFALAAVTATMLAAGGAAAAELPSYEVMGLPITPHQVVILGSAHVQERSPASTLTLAGMPASQHQIAVLTPRKKVVGQLTAATQQ